MVVEQTVPFTGELPTSVLSSEKTKNLFEELAAHRVHITDHRSIHPLEPLYIDRSAARIRFLVPDGHQMKVSASFDAQGQYVIQATAYSQFQPPQEIDICAQKGVGVTDIQGKQVHDRVIHLVGDELGMPIFEGRGLLQRPATKLVVKFGDPLNYSGYCRNVNQPLTHILQIYRSDFHLKREFELDHSLHEAVKHKQYWFRHKSGSQIAVKTVVVYTCGRPAFVLVTPLANVDYFFDHLESDRETAIVIRKSTGVATKIHHDYRSFNQLPHVIRDGHDLFLRDEELSGVGVPLIMIDCIYQIGDHRLRGMYLHDVDLSQQFFHQH